MAVAPPFVPPAVGSFEPAGVLPLPPTPALLVAAPWPCAPELLLAPLGELVVEGVGGTQFEAVPVGCDGVAAPWEGNAVVPVEELLGSEPPPADPALPEVEPPALATDCGAPAATQAAKACLSAADMTVGGSGMLPALIVPSDAWALCDAAA